MGGQGGAGFDNAANFLVLLLELEKKILSAGPILLSE